MKFYGELQHFEDDTRFKVFEVEATDPRDAHIILGGMIMSGATGDYDFVYQITWDFPGVELPQPVYDFFNGFSIYEEPK